MIGDGCFTVLGLSHLFLLSFFLDILNPNMFVIISKSCVCMALYAAPKLLTCAAPAKVLA
jgi:hypothetical protein